MKVRDLLRKDTTLVGCRPEDTVETIAGVLARANIGALPVLDAERRLVGVLSERDIARAFSVRGAKVVAMTVRDLMTHDVATVSPDDTVQIAMETMRRRHIRHLVVIEQGSPVAMLSQRDVLESLLEETKLEMAVLRDRVIANR